MSSTVRIPWVREFDNKTYWNKVCAWAIEYFGLPGDRFTMHANVDNADFVFRDSKDALLMSLRWNAEIIPDEQLTVEFVGSLM